MAIYLCQRCDHAWYSRSDDTPCVCPKCKSPYWDKPRKGENRKETPVRLIK